MKYVSMIMIQRPNKSPCNGNTRVPNFVCNNHLKDNGNSFFGTKKVFCFWNSCHTTKPSLETPMLPQWWLWVKISNRNAVKSCRSAGILLLHDNATADKSCTSRAAVRKCGFVVLNHPPYRQTWLPVTILSSETLKKFCIGDGF